MIIFNSYAKLPEGTSGQVGPSNGLEVGAVLQRVGKHAVFPKRYVWRMDLRKQQKWNETKCIKSVGQSR